MGYTDISISGSDMAADLGYSIADSIALLLNTELQNNENSCYNTNGCVNVALIFEELINKTSFMSHEDELYKVAKECRHILEQDLKNSVAAEWDSKDNKDWHINRYNELILELQKYIDAYENYL